MASEGLALAWDRLGTIMSYSRRCWVQATPDASQPVPESLPPWKVEVRSYCQVGDIFAFSVFPPYLLSSLA